MDLLEQILPLVQKPARYTGGEWNIVRKDWAKADIKVAFAFPDVYEVGMSHLGLQILYHVVNSRSDALMERVFAPWPDMEEKMREHGLPLFALESYRPVRDFDVIAFTLQYEMCYSNVLNMLDLAGIPLRSNLRGEKHPLVIAGGPCAFNPEPLADFIDLFVIGEGEEAIEDFLDSYREAKSRNLARKDFLTEAARVPGVYVPSLYRVEYRADGEISKVEPVLEGVPEVVEKRVVRDLDKVSFPTRPVVPSTQIVHDRIMIEVLRGCTRGCRFCQAGMIYRPVREKKPATVLRQAAELVRQTGYDEISLTSLSTSDYTPVRSVIAALIKEHAGRGVGVSLPSLRVDNFSMELAKEVQKVRRSSITLAPEAGTQRLRDVINKGVTEEDLMAATEVAFREGWQAVKLYFMIGLPTETNEDLDGIIRLAREVLAGGRKAGARRGRLRVTVSVSSFVPKAHTPFQWEPQLPLAVLKERQAYLAAGLRERGLVFNYHDTAVSFMEAVFARGDRRLGAVLENAFHLGCKFDGWSENFYFEKWLEAFRQAGLEPGWYAYRRYEYNSVLPWEHIGAGLSKQYLMLEHQRALAGETTDDCRTGACSGCGLCPGLEVEPDYAGGEGDAQLPDAVQ
ncbi:TIGR03960 family B12-binding radical SAM protein [Pelotomaculum terephthalicicum JT]|uniref:TIGR03960 family B12-binding radical SAM protein n=1 Tax=Pelotomaculum TaxID=191373 RepID=UPI0009CC8550|nr:MULTISPECIES: TIGR03960 family B12-binding radical SAM protein [Pelotomaculum]MCG9967004.1 TIGR03960 family B12-binding radical SAM protein [Pelotomaculum terephthalicicum JT]OPX89309.1 MAG: Radical SAM superfamily protein [Pelotomaculum sp. PtaB.Bin117]OPY62623.1 MAG: Radical SAM superfamily protein [Pelotomaculum sp. PtaU1.Bin065]